ncbi:RimK family alpha-L-glutamate ligase [Thermosulfurimonas sp. F29]|uniref:ATP-grasp domain-containing protein n=1 Tax=Thermosulfurimonas sp. F29 TaxID=2867247 RepID=UPI001C833E0B|nr:hypothetical protein [Thermosulfurimonas sp. F29]MBX6422684.1 hypothetical protein [Thermosulfurimonas sp. F29]
MRPPWVITSNRTLRERYEELGAGDLILTRISLKPGEEGLLLDLATRGVRAFPSLLSQALSRSKALQATVLGSFMPPGTRVIRDRHDVIRALTEYAELGVEEVVTKEDRANCGLGVHLWRSVEEIFNHAGREPLRFPFVLQPRFRELRDIRVVILGDYVEAYERCHPYSFRHNLYFGGHSRPYELSEGELEFCRRVMRRGDFPYAHLDMVYTREGGPYLMEINLRGGLKGSRLTQEEYQKRLAAITESFLESWLETHPGARVF